MSLDSAVASRCRPSPFRSKVRRGGWGRAGLALVLASVLTGVVSPTAEGCPFCPQSLAPSLGEQMASAQVVVVATWVELVPVEGSEKQHTRFEITRVLKKHPQGPAKGEAAIVPLERPGPKGSIEIWFGTVNEGKLSWTYRTTATGSAIPYLEKAPAADLPVPRRLE